MWHYYFLLMKFFSKNNHKNLCHSYLWQKFELFKAGIHFYIICIRINHIYLSPHLTTHVMANITLNINNKEYRLDADPQMPLLWAIRDMVGLKGTKYGCGVAQCGACVVHMDGEAVRSCVTRISRAAGKKIITIEGLSENNNHPVQQAWQQIDVPQCGYCHSGQIMSAAVLLKENPNPSDQDIDDAMAGNICRCGTYLRIRKAIHLAAEMQQKTANG